MRFTRSALDFIPTDYMPINALLIEGVVDRDA
jgi:hypothetical protein